MFLDELFPRHISLCHIVSTPTQKIGEVVCISEQGWQYNYYLLSDGDVMMMS